MTVENTVTSPPSPPPTEGYPPPSAGTILSGRFRIEHLAGRGGMGSVYRAIDLHTGQPVALKLLHAVTSPEAAYRFSREAVLLSELRHPAIVSYVFHGTAEGGQPFLVMEWLEGENLAQRLLRQSLSLSEILSLLRRAAEGLSTAHQQNIVHRDLKPSNLFLKGGRPEDVVLLDFGLARHVVSTDLGLTGSNIVLGTPGYMAPEQASSQADIAPGADIFSLGCVLYECLMGQSPFKAPHFAAALAKILFADPLPLLSRRADLPLGMQVLVDRMLAKDPRQRLPDASRLLEALSTLEAAPRLQPPPTEEVEKVYPAPFPHAEQQLVSVLLVSLSTQAASPQKRDQARGLTLRDLVRTALAPYKARVELLADGSLVVTLRPERGSATDQAALAARCALALKERVFGATVVLVTGLGVLNEHLPVGEAMDKAGRLLRQFEPSSGSDIVVMDEVTAGLLGPGFQLSRSTSGTFLLQGEQLDADASRPLLGKPTPCVGREQELALLEFAFSSCVEEPTARAVLVSAPPGVGKSRLRHEFLRRIERREQQVLLLLGRGDPMSAGASHCLLGQALRRLCDIAGGEGLEARQARLSQRMALHLPEAGAQETVEFLGELCAIPFPDESSPRLQAARGDPRLMSAQLGRAWMSFLQAECAHHPVLLVLEDLHWSDALTLKLVGEALRELAEQPFMVLALARPEAKELFPNLWSRSVQELSLNGLNRKASARLIREVLGPQVPEAIVQRTVEQSDGNALFLEELIRMVAEGRGEAPPETVLAVLQARLLRMEAGVRQVLLAASIFGRTFWAGGVHELLAGQAKRPDLKNHLQQLVALEVIEPVPTSRFLGEDEYRFRHALVRDAAYSLVPDDQRLTGHRLAGAWLEQVGEPDAVTLATHYQLGQQLQRALHFHLQAAERFFDRHDLPDSMRCVEAARACGATGENQTRLNALQSMVALWMEQLPRGLALGGSALNGLEPGGRLWCRLMGGLIFGSAHEGRQEEASRLSELLLRTTPGTAAISAYAGALAYMGVAVTRSGARQKMEELLGRLMEVGADVMAHDAKARGWWRFAKGYFLHVFEAMPWQTLKLTEQGAQDFLELGLERNWALLQAHAGAALAALGDLPGARERLQEALVAARRTEQHLATTHAQLLMLPVLAGSSEEEARQEAYSLAKEWVESADTFAFKRAAGGTTLARLLAASGELAEAEMHARKACELLEPHRAYLVHARTLLCTVLLAQGRAAEARQVAALGVQELEQLGISGVRAVAMRLALAETCFAAGEASQGESALREALRCVQNRANDIPDPTLRERFLSQVPENARTLELARQRWGYGF